MKPIIGHDAEYIFKKYEFLWEGYVCPYICCISMYFIYKTIEWIVIKLGVVGVN
jgi:hypothetical protein